MLISAIVLAMADKVSVESVITAYAIGGVFTFVVWLMKDWD